MFLDEQEEKVLFRHYEKRLLDFCAIFKPTMPKSVVVINVLYQLKMGSSSVPFWLLYFKSMCMFFRAQLVCIFEDSI